MVPEVFEEAVTLVVWADCGCPQVCGVGCLGCLGKPWPSSIRSLVVSYYAYLLVINYFYDKYGKILTNVVVKAMRCDGGDICALLFLLLWCGVVLVMLLFLLKREHKRLRC